MKSTIKSQGRAYKLENIYGNLEFSAILKNPYTGESFVGYENISLNFPMLKYALTQQDWKAALENVKGIYLIADKKTGKKYVGSAYGEYGIWARWNTYMENGHGGNKELKALLNKKKKSKKYAEDNFRFTLIEYWPFKTQDNFIIERESFWKEALLTRKHGYNSN